MQERNVISGTATAVLSTFVDGWESLIMWLVVAFVLVMADLKFGIQASMKRGEKIRGSRVIRRTVNKMVDYICWVAIAWVLGSSFGKIFNIPLLVAIIMFIVCSIEISSIFDNYFEYKGLNKRFNAWKFFSRLFRISIVEESIEDKKQNGNESDK